MVQIIARWGLSFRFPEPMTEAGGYHFDCDPHSTEEPDDDDMGKKIHLKTREEIELMRISAQLVSKTLGMVAKEVKPGVTPLHLDTLAEEFIRSHDATPAFKGLYGFPNSLCISVNEQVIHGIPKDVPLKEGDVISVDCGVLKDGWYGDHAFTYPIGQLESKTEKLLRVTRRCLELGIEQAMVGNRIGAIGNAIQTHAEKYGFGVVEEYVGHGVGRKLHEAPQIPNYGRVTDGPEIKDGMVLAIEPMINMGTRKVKQLKDKWTVVSADGKPSAHFEHDVAIIDGKPEILSTFDYVDEILGNK